MSSLEPESQTPQFELYDYYCPKLSPIKDINGLVEEGRLPTDTLFRLASVGQRVDSATRSTYLNFTMMAEILKYINSPDQMREETQKILFGDLPDAVVDINSAHNYPFYEELDMTYYRMEDLVRTVHNRRSAWGQALPDERYNGSLRIRVPQDEWSRCQAIARPIWRLIAQRSHPEWLENPSDYFFSRYIGNFCCIYEIGESTQRRGIVSHAVFSDPLVFSIYEEAISSGVKGIGKVGKEDLRLLLLDEHPELMEGHEIPTS